MTQENYANKGYHSYSVSANVKRHLAYGLGVYSYFRDYTVKMDTGIKAPSGSGIKFTNTFNKMLNGNGGIEHVINTYGGSAYSFGMSYLCGLHEESPMISDPNNFLEGRIKVMRRD